MIMGITNKSTNPSVVDDNTNSYSQPFTSAENTNENEVQLETRVFAIQECPWTIDDFTDWQYDSSSIEHSISARKMDSLQTLEKNCLQKLYGDCMTESLSSASFTTVSVRENNLTLASTLFATDNENVGCHEEIQGEYYENHYTYTLLTEINYGNGIIFRCIGQRISYHLQIW